MSFLNSMTCRLLGLTLCALIASGCSGREPKAPPAPAPTQAPSLAASPGDGGVRDVVSPLSPEEEWFRAASVADLQARLSDLHFDYDRDELRSDARTTIQQNFEWLSKPYNTVRMEIEGHCDERGTEGYNLALGDRRATSVANYLVSLGFPRNRMTTISYGKERPQCREAAESCWSKNRRAHFRVVSKGEPGSDR
jgi:peptidoglycan-associated lipoprotein